MRTISRWRLLNKSVVAALLVTWFLFSSLLTASPTLHKWLHDDAAQTSHQCAITLFQQQQFLLHSPQQFIQSGDSHLIYFVQSPDFSPASAEDWQLLPGRAPPVSFSI